MSNDLMRRSGFAPLVPATERGSITMMGAATMCVLLVAGALVAATFSTGWDIIKTRNTVDLAALSAAQTLADGGSSREACSVARQVASALRIGCEVDGDVVKVTGVKEGKFLWITDEISARAVAGPAREYSRSRQLLGE